MKFQMGETVIFADGGLIYDTGKDFAAYFEMEGFEYHKPAYGYEGEECVIIARGGSIGLYEKYGVRMKDGSEFVIGVSGLRKCKKSKTVGFWKKIFG